MNNELDERNKFIMYTTDDGQVDIEVRLEDENVWLTQNSMAGLFDTTKQNISLHIKNIFEEKELEENSVVKHSLTTAKDGKNYKTKFYNLDLIISVGYRVRSVRGTQFRIWANKLIKEYLIKGYNINVKRFKNNGGGTYFEEVLEKIRDIRSSEKVFWRKIIDIYATSVDYDAKNEQTREFFKTVQNKKMSRYFLLSHIEKLSSPAIIIWSVISISSGISIARTAFVACTSANDGTAKP